MPGRMLDGLASSMGASFCRTPPAIEKDGQANLRAYVKTAGVQPTCGRVSVRGHDAPIKRQPITFLILEDHGVRTLVLLLPSRDWALTC